MPLLLLQKLVQILLMLTMLNAVIYANVFNAELCCDVCCVAINMDQLYSNVYWLEVIQVGGDSCLWIFIVLCHLHSPFFKVHPCFARYPLHTWIIAIAARQHPACIYSYSLDLNGSCPTARSFTQQIWQQGTRLSQNHNDRFVALNLQVMGRFLRNGGQERFACLLNLLVKQAVWFSFCWLEHCLVFPGPHRKKVPRTPG